MYQRSNSLPADRLAIDIMLVCEMMASVGYVDESLRLGLAAESPGSASSRLAREGLTRAAVIAAEMGFPNVAEWISDSVLRARAATVHER